MPILVVLLKIFQVLYPATFFNRFYILNRTFYSVQYKIFWNFQCPFVELQSTRAKCIMISVVENSKEGAIKQVGSRKENCNKFLYTEASKDS